MALRDFPKMLGNCIGRRWTATTNDEKTEIVVTSIYGAFEITVSVADVGFNCRVGIKELDLTLLEVNCATISKLLDECVAATQLAKLLHEMREQFGEFNVYATGYLQVSVHVQCPNLVLGNIHINESVQFVWTAQDGSNPIVMVGIDSIVNMIRLLGK